MSGEVSSVIPKGFILYASETGAHLNADVHMGGGDDDTEILQAALDRALEWGHLHLILDGAARVRGLKIHSNTTIECPDADCGLFMSDDIPGPVLRTAHYSLRGGERTQRNIALIGGTYNHNNAHHRHRAAVTEEYGDWHSVVLHAHPGYERPNIAIELTCVENVTVRDVAIQDNSAWAMLVCNFKNVNIENVHLDLRNHYPSHNQDGLHFWGPGQFLNIRNVYGRSGDDFIALAPDEHDGVSDITDVLIDGLALEHADQCVRMLSREKGRLDRVSVRNCYGECTSMGFYINYWFNDSVHHGNYGSLYFENIDLRTCKNSYSPAFLFRIGANIDSIVCRNIAHRAPYDERPLFDFGYYSYSDVQPDTPPSVRYALIDGLCVQENGGDMKAARLINVNGSVDNLVIRNADVLRNKDAAAQGTFIQMHERGHIGRLELDNVRIERMEAILDRREGAIDSLEMRNVRGNGVTGEFFGE